jgi:hypothetical protein
MSADVHTRAQELILTGSASAEEQRWLEEHLATCRDCGGLLQGAQAVRSALRSTPIMADPAMVAATVRRTLRFAAEQREQESHRFLLRVTIALAAMLAWISVPLLWKAAQWAAGFTPQPQLAAFGIFSLVAVVPAVLAAVAALAARGSSSPANSYSSLHSKGDL